MSQTASSSPPAPCSTRDLDEVVSRTRDAVELVRLASVEEDVQHAGARLRALARGGESVLVSGDLEPSPLPPRFLLSADSEQVGAATGREPQRALADRRRRAAGTLPARAAAPGAQAPRELVVVVADPTKVFLWKRGPEWYERQGVQLRTLNRIALEAITVNPVAPQSHRFDSAQLRGRLAEAIPDVPIFDVLHPDYAGAHPAARAAALPAG